MKNKEKSFLKERKDILTDERGIKKRKLLLDLKIHQKNLIKFNVVKKRLQNLENNFVKKLNPLNKKIAMKSSLLKKLYRDRIDFNNGKGILNGSLSKTDKAISREKNRIRILGKKLTKFK